MVNKIEDILDGLPGDPLITVCNYYIYGILVTILWMFIK